MTDAYLEDASFRYLREVKELKWESYEELLKEFESSPMKVGEKNGELLWNCHRTLFLKMGVSKVYLDNWQEILVEEETKQRKIPWDMEYYMTITGFFTNLTGGLDLLAQEINMICDLQFDEKISFSHIVYEMKKSSDRIARGTDRPRDRRVKTLCETILKFGKGESSTFERISAYRNFFMHRRNLPTQFSVGVVGVGTFYADNSSGSPAFSYQDGKPVPVKESKILSLKLEEMKRSLPPFAANVVSFGPPLHVQRTLRLPRKDRLKCLPSELNVDKDFEQIDAYELCETFYNKTLGFIEKIGKNLLEIYKAL